MRTNPLDEGYRWLEQAQADLGWTRHLYEQGAAKTALSLAEAVVAEVVAWFTVTIFSVGKPMTSVVGGKMGGR